MKNIIVWDGFKLIGLGILILTAIGIPLAFWIMDKYYNWKRNKNDKERN